MHVVIFGVRHPEAHEARDELQPPKQLVCIICQTYYGAILPIPSEWLPVPISPKFAFDRHSFSILFDSSSEISFPVLSLKRGVSFLLYDSLLPYFIGRTSSRTDSLSSSVLQMKVLRSSCSLSWSFWTLEANSHLICFRPLFAGKIWPIFVLSVFLLLASTFLPFPRGCEKVTRALDALSLYML